MTALPPASHLCSHPDGFVRDDRVPYQMRVENGYKIEQWHECCPVCKTWINVKRTETVRS